MITDNSEEHEITLLFDVRLSAEAEALHYWRAAFAGASDVEEAVDENLYALRLRPGVCRCGDGA
jgi:hypothetical protein